MPESPEKPGSPAPRRSARAELVDAVANGAATVAKMNPQQTVNLVCIIALTAIVAIFAFKAWSEGEERQAERKANTEAHNAQIRENNAQMELTRNHCANEMDRANRRADDQIKQILATFMAEGAATRTHQSMENEKMRATVAAAIKGQVER